MINKSEFVYPINDGFHEPETGLTKRELFSAMAMQGMLANGSIDFETFDTVAHDSVLAADRLIKKLNSTDEK